MTVRRVVTASGCTNLTGTGYAPEGEIHGDSSNGGPLKYELTRALRAADRANNALLQERDGRWTVQGDPTEGALIVWLLARRASRRRRSTRALPRIGEVPFSSERKLMSTVHADAEKSGRLIALTKGAPDVLLMRCSHELVGKEAQPLTDGRRAEILLSNDALALDALRTFLGVAFRSLPINAADHHTFDDSIEQKLVFLGLIGMIDPPREEAKAAVAKAKGAGIRPIMITGDHPKTAAVIAAELGVAANGRVIVGAELETCSTLFSIERFKMFRFMLA